MTTVYFLKMRTTKKACHRASFQTARVRRLVRRKHRGELAPHTERIPSAQLSSLQEDIFMPLLRHEKEYRQYYPCTSALYHINASLSREIRTYVCKFLREILLICLYLSYLLQYNKREERYGCESILASDFFGILLKYY